MEVVNAEDARAWLRAWNNRPRPGILKEVIRGMKLCASLTKQKDPEGSQHYANAAAVLADALPR